MESLKKCPFCAESINAEAKKCKHCGEFLDVVMRDMEALKSQKQQIFMNAGGASSSSLSGPGSTHLREYNHFPHICITILTLGLWIPFWVYFYAKRDRRFYV